MNNSSRNTVSYEQTTWNQAHDRLRDYLNSFALGDHAQVSRLTLKLLDEARDLHRQNPSLDPVGIAMAQAQKQTEEWIESNVELKNQAPAKILASGCVALLLSQAFRTSPETFLTAPLPVDLKESMRRTLLVTGPDLQISSMTPRELDYGPMLDLARTTWHRWSAQEILIAVLFWAGVYFISYWWLSQVL